MLNLHIKDITNKELFSLRGFLQEQDLGYIQYDKWVDRVCIPELDAQYKQGYVVLSNGAIVASLIFQPHKELPLTLELKNLRVNKSYRRRDISHFLLKNAEVFAGEMGYQKIICDFREGKDYSSAVMRLLLFSGYSILFKADVYKSNQVDYIMHKTLIT